MQRMGGALATVAPIEQIEAIDLRLLHPPVELHGDLHRLYVMAVYTPGAGIASSINDTINHALLAVTVPVCPEEGRTSPVHLLMNGHGKAAIIEWRGDLADDFNEPCDRRRGDGDVSIIAEQAMTMLPPNVPEDFNRWAAISTWLLGFTGDEQPVVIGAGLIYPWLNAAHLDFWDVRSGAYVARTFFCDPRPQFNNGKPRKIGLRVMGEKATASEQNAALIPNTMVGDRPTWQ